MSGPIVEILDGLVRGKVYHTESGKSYYSFTGIPYAKPPIGKSRFCDAVPAENWQGIKECTQEDLSFKQFNFVNEEFMGTEELIVSVDTPQLPYDQSEPVPVIVFLHGGGFKMGSCNRANFTPDYILDQGTVVVGIQSRLGIFGYLCLDIAEAPGNIGLKDQVLALKWVQNNINSFGGDPNNVCLYGMSSGASQVEMHMLSPLSNGLFHKLIATSSCSLNHWAVRSDPIPFAFKVGKTLGYSGNDKLELLHFLENASAGDLVKAAQDLKEGHHDKTCGFTFPFAPVVEKEFDGVNCFLRAHPIDLLKSGDFAKVPYIMGISDREGLTFTRFHPQKLKEAVEGGDLFAYLPYRIGEHQKNRIASKIINIYTSKMQSAPAGTFPDSAIDFFGDLDFASGVIMSAKLIAKHSPQVYLYYFAYDGNFNCVKKHLKIDAKGATHCDQDGYVFGSGFTTEKGVAADYLIRDRMLWMWKDFIKTGNPTPKLSQLIDTQWQPVDHIKLNYLKITEELRMNDDILGERRKLWEDIYFDAQEHHN